MNTKVLVVDDNQTQLSITKEILTNWSMKAETSANASAALVELQQAHESGKTLICGHTSQDSGLPVNLGHSICIDTAAYKDGWLTCLEVDSGHYWQTNQEGERRKDVISAHLE